MLNLFLYFYHLLQKAMTNYRRTLPRKHHANTTTKQASYVSQQGPAGWRGTEILLGKSHAAARVAALRMTVNSQNPQGGVSHERNSSKNAAHHLKDIKIGTWNVRTMYGTGKLQLLAKEMTKLNCNICSLAETRWSGNGHFTTLGGTHNVYYSGSKERGNKGVAFIIDKKQQNQYLATAQSMRELLA